MSMATLERAVLYGAQTVLKNPKLRKKDILAWNTGKLEAETGEVVVRVPDPGVWVVVAQEHDKRK
jgi:hypothetical protein